MNLVDNAIKFTRKGSITLTITLAEKNCSKQKNQKKLIIKFSVQDTGIGIPYDKQPLIFTRFSRLHPAYEGQYAGSGLGLALVKHMVSELGGEIYVDSEENQGATFHCLIPLRPALLMDAQYVIHPPELKSPESSLPLTMNTTKTSLSLTYPPHQQQKILLVEDNMIVQRGIKNQLEQALAVVIETADNGQQALAKIQMEDYPLILMDIGLPDQDGCMVAMAIHRWQKRHRSPLSFIVALVCTSQYR